jgi:hypothetical protein
MTLILHGDRLEIANKLAGIKDLDRIHGVPPEEATPKAIDTWCAMRWKANTLPRRPLAFIDPPKDMDPDGLPRRGDRIVVFYDDAVLPKPWAAWAKAVDATVQHLKAVNPEQFVAYLVAGKGGFPRFTPEAARHIAQSNPGGKEAILRGLAPLLDREPAEPVSLEDAVAVWPWIPEAVKGDGTKKAYKFDMLPLLKSLGRPGSLKLVNTVPTEDTFRALMFLKTACANSENRIQLFDILFDGMIATHWSPRIALVLFVHLCYLEATCPASTDNSLPSKALTRLYRIYGIPSVPS